MLQMRATSTSRVLHSYNAQKGSSVLYTRHDCRTLSRYRSRISRPQLAHTFLPVDGTDEAEALDVGEQMDGVDGGLGEQRGSSFSITDLWDSPSEWDCTGPGLQKDNNKYSSENFYFNRKTGNI